MKNITLGALRFLLCLALVQAFSARADTLLVGGTGSATPLMKLLFEEFGKQAPELTLNVVSPALGSGGGIRSLATGKIDMAVLSRLPKADEQALLGPHFALADTPFVLATNGGHKAKGFSLDELAAVYLGQLSSWDNGDPIRLVLRTRDDSETALLKSMSPLMDKAVTVADQRAGMVYGIDDIDALALLSRAPGSLGPSSLGLLRASGSHLTVLPLAGRTPSIAALQNGSYPWRKTLTVVLPVQASQAATKFAAFLRSDQAKAILLRYDYLPAGQ